MKLWPQMQFIPIGILAEVPFGSLVFSLRAADLVIRGVSMGTKGKAALPTPVVAFGGIFVKDAQRSFPFLSFCLTQQLSLL